MAARWSVFRSEPRRFNVFAHWGEPVVTLSTHMDTVPPFFASREDDEHIWGRGACDTKGIIASMICAVARAAGSRAQRNFGLLFVVGEERNSAGAFAAAKQPRGSQFLINGEPTENKLALGSKGALPLRARRAAAAWRIRLIRSWANRPSRNCWMRWSEFAACRCRWTRCWAPAR